MEEIKKENLKEELTIKAINYELPRWHRGARSGRWYQDGVDPESVHEQLMMTTCDPVELIFSHTRVCHTFLTKCMDWTLIQQVKKTYDGAKYRFCTNVPLLDMAPLVLLAFRTLFRVYLHRVVSEDNVVTATFAVEATEQNPTFNRVLVFRTMKDKHQVFRDECWDEDEELYRDNMDDSDDAIEFPDVTVVF
jgi:hypothetical protein